MLAEEWLRSQDLDEAADRAFSPLPGRAPARLAVVLAHEHRARLEQVCSDDDVSVEHVLAVAVQEYLNRRCGVRPDFLGPASGTVPWWPAGVAKEFEGWVAPAPPATGVLTAETLEP